MTKIIEVYGYRNSTCNAYLTIRDFTENSVIYGDFPSDLCGFTTSKIEKYTNTILGTGLDCFNWNESYQTTVWEGLIHYTHWIFMAIIRGIMYIISLKLVVFYQLDKITFPNQS